MKKQPTITVNITPSALRDLQWMVSALYCMKAMMDKIEFDAIKKWSKDLEEVYGSQLDRIIAAQDKKTKEEKPVFEKKPVRECRVVGNCKIINLNDWRQGRGQL